MRIMSRYRGQQRQIALMMAVIFSSCFLLLSRVPNSLDTSLTERYITREQDKPITKGRQYRKRDLQRALHKPAKEPDGVTKDNTVFYGSFPIMYQDNPKLVSYVRGLIHPPAPRDVPYNFTRHWRRYFSQYNQSIYLTEELLRGMRNGIFVELGALDGETHSNTVFLERELGWTGLLIEPLPEGFRNLTKKGRKAYSINAGAALTNKSAIEHFKVYDYNSLGLSHITNKTSKTVAIKTFPLYTMLLAVNITTIDFLSLDVEGDELKVLQTMPWDKVQVRVMCVEINHVEGGAPAVINYMEKQGYILLSVRYIDAWFAKKELLEETMGIKLIPNTLEYNVMKDY
ncbi:uncharacterized protein LOC135213114 isoform X2 [Macrobrachium nipponense]|uniref:uncharacterized protein LOC135213114 isoform X2 n=2 Tax=Macrobrachium nipponense TaxID=159736 RepID=UPI0030C81703